MTPDQERRAAELRRQFRALTEDQPWLCPDCDGLFSGREGWDLHVRRSGHHGGRQATAADLIRIHGEPVAAQRSTPAGACFATQQWSS